MSTRDPKRIAWERDYREKNREKIREGARVKRERNLDRVREQARRHRSSDKCKDTDLRRVYGISLAERNAMAERQNNLCALCGMAKKLCIDHDHETGRVRGLLCRRCNAALGTFGDNVAGLERVIAYLRGEQ